MMELLFHHVLVSRAFRISVIEHKEISFKDKCRMHDCFNDHHIFILSRSHLDSDILQF